jgi:TPR repeat protein
MLGTLYRHGIGCENDTVRAIELYKRAAELEVTPSEYWYGTLAFGEHDWQRYDFWGRSVLRGTDRRNVCEAVLDLLPLFERGELGRVLHTVTRLARHVVAAQPVWVSVSDMNKYQRVVELHEAMLGRARRAIDCWSMASGRIGVVKDMRVMIAKMAWEEPWRWGEQKNEELQGNKRTKRDGVQQ